MPKDYIAFRTKDQPYLCGCCKCLDSSTENKPVSWHDDSALALILQQTAESDIELAESDIVEYASQLIEFDNSTENPSKVQ
jgi:hypothetical protein